MSCNDCHYADWKRTKIGKLHPGGDGRCTFVWVAPALPKAFYWVSGHPMPNGGHIKRGDESTAGCPYFR